MKYRDGHGEEVMTPLSQSYCARARKRLLAMNSAWASSDAVAALAPDATATAAKEIAKETSHQAVLKPIPGVQPSSRPEEVYTHYRQGTAAASNAFWAAHEARIRQIRARVEARWRRVASR